MIRFFVSNRVAATFLLPFIILAFHLLNNHFEYHEVSNEINFGFWSGLFHFSSLVSQLLGGIFIILNALTLNYLYNNYDFQDKNTYIISLIYVVLMSFYYSFYRLDGILFSHLFFILSLTKYFKLKQNNEGRETIFNCALFLGIASTFQPPLLLFFPIYVVMYLIIRPFSLREFLLFTAGFLAPLLIATIYLKLSMGKLNFDLIISNAGNQIHQDFIVVLCFILILLVLSILGIRARILKSSNRLKKQIQIMWFMCAIAIGMGSIDLFIFKQNERFSLIVLPLAILLSYSFLSKRFELTATITFYLTIAYAVIKFFIPLS